MEETDRLVERVIERTGRGNVNETAMENGRERKETGVRGTKIGKERGNEKETERGSVNGRETGIVTGDGIVGTGTEGMRGTGRNVLQLESRPGSRENLVGSPQGNP